MPTYDVAIVGARVAGAATAMLLARAGHRVVVVDRAAYGSDTLSTHALMRGGVQQLDRWGLLDRIVEAGTPPVHRVTFNYDGAPVVIDVAEPLYAPRRTVLDRVLADAAREAGAQVRFATHVTGLVRRSDGAVGGLVVTRPDGTTEELHATVTVGADGMRSRTARAVAAPVTTAATHATATVYGHWAGVEADGYEWWYADGRGFGLIPTNEGLVCGFSLAPERFAVDLGRNREGLLQWVVRDLAPEVAERLAAGHRVGPLRGFPGLRGWLRRPYGPGWALVGDAGYFKDPVTAHGMTDALRDAELLARALDDGLRGVRPMSTALAGYERVRDELSLPLLRLTDAIAALDRPMPELQQLHRQFSRELQRESRFVDGLDPFPAVRSPVLTGVGT